MTPQDQIRQQVTRAVEQAFHAGQQDLIDSLTETLSAFDYLRRHFLTPGECFTLPDGQCLGVGCVHDTLQEERSGQ